MATPAEGEVLGVSHITPPPPLLLTYINKIIIYIYYRTVNGQAIPNQTLKFIFISLAFFLNASLKFML
jgi:hypothetical protein